MAAASARLEGFFIAALAVSPIFYVYRLPPIGMEPFRLVQAAAAMYLGVRFVLSDIRLTRGALRLFGYLVIVAVVPAFDLVRMGEPGRLAVNVANHVVALLLVVMMPLFMRSGSAFWHFVKWATVGSCLAFGMALWKLKTGSLPFPQFVASRAGSDASLDEFAFVIENQLRLSAGFYDPNFYGLYIVLVVAMITTWLVYRGPSKWMIAALVMNCAALFLTMSRTSVIGLAVLFLVFVIGSRQARRVAVPITLVIAVSLTVGFAIWGIPDQLVFFKRFDDLDRSAGRLPYHMAGVEAAKANPIVGVGSERFLQYVQQYASSGRPSAHLVYLSWMAKYGIVGSTIYLVFLLGPVYCAAAGRGLARWFRHFVFAAYLPLLVMYLAYDYFDAQVIQYLVFGIAWSFCVNSQEMSSPVPVSASSE